jgi:hypothetical protein
MPQTVDPPKRPVSTHEKVLAGAAAGGAAIETAKSVVAQGQDIKTVASDGLDLIRPVQPYLQPHILIAGGIIMAALVAVFFLRRTA